LALNEVEDVETLHRPIRKDAVHRIVLIVALTQFMNF